MEREVFICHSTADVQTAVAICKRLEDGGIGCWIAPRNEVGGIPYGRQIVDAIAKAPILLLVLSENASASSAVLGEVELAANRRKIVFPVRIDAVPPSEALEYYIRAIHWFDATGSLAEVAPELLRQVRDLLGRSAEPPAVISEAPPHNLPLALTSFVGREREVGEVEEMLGDTRLVTLCGPGGIGKTSLAVQVAVRRLDAFPDGVRFVDLSQAEEPSLVAKIFAETLDLEESAGRPIAGALLAHLKKKNVLLIADNCEHVVAETARLVESILRAAPHVKIMATTREALGVPGEQVYPVPTLAVPPATALRALKATDALAYGAIALFADRGRAVNRAFALTDENAPVVATICARLDGIALAIELAAARVRVLAPKQLAESLDRRFLILTGGARTALPRHETVRALIDWSYDQLAENERVLFRRLGVFAGSFTRDNAVAVCSGNAIAASQVLPLLDSLVDKSLVQADFTAEETRYRLLELMRAYSLDKLADTGELEALNRTHAIAFTKVAEELEAAWETTPDGDWKARAEPSLENWRAALRWAFGAGGDVVLGGRLAAALRPVWFALAPSEGRRWVGTALNAVADSGPREAVARLQLSDAHLAMLAMQFDAALPRAEGALAAFAQLDQPYGVAFAQMFVGAARGFTGDVAGGAPLLEEALAEFRRGGSSRTIASALIYLGTLQIIAGSPNASRKFFHEALPLLRAVGATRAAAHIALPLAEAEFAEGNARKAVELVEEGLEADRALNNLDQVAFDLCNLAAYLVALDRWDEAAACAREALNISRERELGAATVWALQHLAAVLALRPRGDGALAQRRHAASVLGYVDAQIAALQLRRDFTDRQEYERVSVALEAALGDDAALLKANGPHWSEARILEMLEEFA